MVSRVQGGRENLKINKCEDRPQLQQWESTEASDLFSVCSEGWFHSFIYIFVVMSHRMWVSGWGYFLYIEKEKKDWERNQTPFTVFFFILKAVLELFHLLFWSSEVLLLLIPFPSDEALVQTSVDFFYPSVPFFFSLPISYSLSSLLSSLFLF